MPFFLVTYKTVVEADDDQDAARKAIEKIEGGERVVLEVKFDEKTSTRVVIRARNVGQPNGLEDLPSDEDSQAAGAEAKSPEEAELASVFQPAASGRFGKGSLLTAVAAIIFLPLLVLLFR